MTKEEQIKAKIMPITKGYSTIVDADDYEDLTKYKWQARIDGQRVYVQRVTRDNGKKKIIAMHRHIMSTPKNICVDHINGNPLDNRKINLRLCTKKQNCQNRRVRSSKNGKYKGAFWHKRQNKWVSTIRVDGKAIHLGVFDDEIDAAIAYNAAAKLHFGEFAQLNEINNNTRRAND